MEIKSTAGMNADLMEAVNRLAEAGFEVFGIEPWGGGLPAIRHPFCVQIALAIPKNQEGD
jgi:hypothetical protein